MDPLTWHRNNYAAARLQGLEADLKMTDEQYQIGLSTLFIGYVLMQVPSNALLNYAGRPSVYIGFFVSYTPGLQLKCPAPTSKQHTKSRPSGNIC